MPSIVGRRLQRGRGGALPTRQTPDYSLGVAAASVKPRGYIVARENRQSKVAPADRGAGGVAQSCHELALTARGAAPIRDYFASTPSAFPFI